MNNEKEALKVFIVEDDINTLSTLQAKLRVEGFTVASDSGLGTIVDAKNKIRLFAPNYIVLDLIMPYFDGFDMIKELKADETFKKIPIFVFTNLSDNDSRARCLELGADFYEVKTGLAIDEFVEKMKRIISNLNKQKK